MGQALPEGGPAGLFIAFLIWGIVMWVVNECFAEMVTYLPIPSPFVRFGSEWVDDALGFAMAWNFFLNEAFLVPFELVAMNIMITFWTDKVPVEAIIVVMIVLYALLNMISVRFFGIAEFYLSIFKVLLMIGLFFFTFITMLGGNPLHDRYGFRYWNNPGAFVEHLASGGTGRFLGILSCLYQASFSWVSSFLQSEILLTMTESVARSTFLSWLPRLRTLERSYHQHFDHLSGVCLSFLLALLYVWGLLYHTTIQRSRPSSAGTCLDQAQVPHREFYSNDDKLEWLSILTIY